MKNDELISYLYENVSMGKEALNSLKKSLDKTDNKIIKHVEASMARYDDYLKGCKKVLKKEKIDKPKTNLIGLLMTKMGTKMEFMKDNSDSKIAETLMQGYNMGIIDVTKNINKYKDCVDKEVISLAENYKKMCEISIEELKSFL